MNNRISSYNRILIEELCAEHNKLRKNPECYIEILRKVLSLIRRNNILHLKGERPFMTIEGKAAVLEAINYLINISKSKSLLDKLSKRLFIISDYLNEASTDHAEDIGLSGSISHEGSDKSHMNERVEKYCDWQGGLAESLDFGTNHAENIMIKLLICDGDKKRTQRNYIFDPGFIYFGAGFAQHMKYRRCSVISYATLVQNKKEELSEFELIQRHLDIHKNFNNKNIIEINSYFNNNNGNKENNKEEIIINEDIISNKADNNNIDEEEDNLSFKKHLKLEEYKDNDKFNYNNNFIIEESENEIDNEKDGKSHKSSFNNKIKKIKEKDIERYGIKINETTYQIKEGNFHIIEKEKHFLNFNFLKNL